jgi:hypothetical protein
MRIAQVRCYVTRCNFLSLTSKRENEMNARKLFVLGHLSIWLLVGFATFSHPCRSQTIEGRQWGASVAGLEISLFAVDSSKGRDPELQLALRNVGDQDITLNLGSMMANGKVQLPDNITLNFSDAQGRVRKFKFGDKKHSMVAGRLDDYVVPLRAGSTYTLRLSLDQFWCQETSEFKVRLLPGKNQLSAEFEGGGAKLVNLDMPGIKLMNFWSGKVQSNTLSIEK